MVHLHCGFAVPGEIKQHTPKQMTWNVTAKAGELDGPSWPNVAEVPAKSAKVHQSQQGVRRSGVDEEVDYATERTSEGSNTAGEKRTLVPCIPHDAHRVSHKLDH